MLPEEPTPEAIKPVCPTCKYDLNGLPDGCCPECGVPFTRAGLSQLASKNSSSYHVVYTMLLYLSALACPMVAPRLANAAAPVLLPIWVFTTLAIWQWASTGKSLRGLLAIAPASILLAARLPELGWVGGSLALLMASLCTGGAAAIGIRTFSNRCMAGTAILVHGVRFGGLWLGVLVLGTSVQIGIRAVNGYREGVLWSKFADPRPDQVHRQYPLTNMEAAVGAATLAILGALLVLWMVTSLRLADSRSASSQ